MRSMFICKRRNPRCFVAARGLEKAPARDAPQHDPSRYFLLLLLRRDVIRRELRAFAEEELLHVMPDDLLRLLVRGGEAGFVCYPFCVLPPQPPRLLPDGLVDTVSPLAI